MREREIWKEKVTFDDSVGVASNSMDSGIRMMIHLMHSDGVWVVSSQHI